MRALALLLIVANLGYMGWALLIDAPAETVRIATAPDTSPRLVLASERVPDPAQATKEPPVRVAAKPAEAAESAAVQKCVSVGPFQDLPTVVQASAAIKGAGYESRQRLEQGELWVGHWVSISGFATHDSAQAAIDKLKTKGVNDAYILPGSDPANVISLGVFKDQERAQRRMNEAKSLGLDATIADRTRSGSVYWVDVELKDNKQSLDTSILSSQPGKIVRLETRSCPA